MTHRVSPTVVHHDSKNASVAMNTPKIHVGITVANGGNSSNNLPDIVIDIEKPKVAGENECFERANVIQEAPNASEKLYILDSIDVPLADLNKYRHLSVVNKLPDNIVLPPENEICVTESLKFIEEVETNHARYFKNDFEMNVEYDDDGKCLLDASDLVECKNITTVRNVRRIIRKYRKQREYLRKTKMSSTHRIRAKIAPPPPTPTPSSLLEMPATSVPVDLSANRPLTPIPETPIKSPGDANLTENDSPASMSSLDSMLSFSTEDLTIGADDPIDPQTLDTLKTMCIRTVNTSQFRDFFTDKFINRRPKVGAAAVTIPMPVRRPTNQTNIIRPEPIRVDGDIIDLTDDSDVVAKPAPVKSRVPLLKHLAMRIVRYNQYQLMVNIRALKLPSNNDAEHRPSTAESNPNGFKVKTLQELAREVANTIYSFNVKPLQDICKLALEKFDNLFILNQIDMQKLRTFSELHGKII